MKDQYGVRAVRARALGRRRLRCHEAIDMASCERASAAVGREYLGLGGAHSLYARERRICRLIASTRRYERREGHSGRNKAITVRPFSMHWADSWEGALEAFF